MLENINIIFTMPIIISLGGSLITSPDGTINTKLLHKWIKMIREYTTQGYSFILITGGGKTARTYQKALQELTNPDKKTLDHIGISATKLNADLFLYACEDIAYPKVIQNRQQIQNTIIKNYPLVISSGWEPGHSTDYIAVQFAEITGAKSILNASNIDYVYTSDPQKNPEAKPISEINWIDFRNIVGNTWAPGSSAPFDPIASRKAQELELSVSIINGNSLDNIMNFLEQKPFIGTVIK